MIKDMEHAGKTIYSLCVGEPDYQPPEAVIEATVRYNFRHLSFSMIIEIFLLNFSKITLDCISVSQQQLAKQNTPQLPASKNCEKRLPGILPSESKHLTLRIRLWYAILLLFVDTCLETFNNLRIFCFVCVCIRWQMAQSSACYKRC